MGTCRIPKNVSANIAGMVEIKAFQSTIAKSGKPVSRVVDPRVGVFTIVAVKMVKRNTRLNSFENPSTVPHLGYIKVGNSSNHNVEYSGNGDEESRYQVRRLRNPAACQQDNRKHQRNYPEVDGVTTEKFLECSKIVLQITIQAGRDFDASDKQEETNTANTPNQDVSGKEINQRSEFKGAKNQEYHASNH